MRVLGIIPARSGSKGIPRKNVRRLAGKPVLAYTAESARAAASLTRLLLSTDSAEIAELGRRLGVEAPFLRPPELARDDTPMVPVLQHAVRFLEEEGQIFDAVCVLQPTCPLRRPDEIDACCRLMESSGADSVFTVRPVPHRYHPDWVYFQSPDAWLRPVLQQGDHPPRRQELRPCFWRDGSVYLVRRRVLMTAHTLFGERMRGYPADPEFSVNLDGPRDWEEAERKLARRERAR